MSSTSTGSSAPTLICYEGIKYPGEVFEVGPDEGDARVSFMELSKGKAIKKLFKWPPREVIVWVFFYRFPQRDQ